MFKKIILLAISFFTISQISAVLENLTKNINADEIRKNKSSLGSAICGFSISDKEAVNLFKDSMLKKTIYNAVLEYKISGWNNGINHNILEIFSFETREDFNNLIQYANNFGATIDIFSSKVEVVIDSERSENLVPDTGLGAGANNGN